MTSASSRTDSRSCRRDPPIVRTVANSRVRWAIVIVRVRDHEGADKAPPRRRRGGSRGNEMKLFVSAASSRACWDAVFTCAVGGSSALRSRTSSSSETSELRRDGDLVESTALPEELLGGGRSKPASVAPPIVGRIRTGRAPRSSRCAAPSSLDADHLAGKSSLSAVDSSTTSSPAFGQAPSTSVVVEGRVSGRDAEAEVR